MVKRMSDDCWYVNSRHLPSDGKPRLWPPTPSSTIPPIYPLLAPERAVRASDWTGELTWTTGGTAIIRGEKPESTHQGLKDNISKD